MAGNLQITLGVCLYIPVLYSLFDFWHLSLAILFHFEFYGMGRKRFLEFHRSQELYFVVQRPGVLARDVKRRNPFLDVCANHAVVGNYSGGLA